MGTASKVCAVVCRFMELISAAIVTGLVGEYLNYVANAHEHAESRIIYTIAIGGISLLLSMILFPPLMYSFYAFLLDYSLFICWMVAFGLMTNLSGGASCSSTWYYTYWGYYWGGYYYTVPRSAITPSLVGSAACGKWQAVLAWSFIGGMWWLGSGLLGTYVVVMYGRHKARADRADAIEERDTIGWHVKARSIGRKVGYNPGVAKTSDVTVKREAV